MNEKIGEYIKRVRVEHNRTQAEVSDWAGISMFHLSRIENVKVMPSLGACERIADAISRDEQDAREIFLKMKSIMAHVDGELLKVGWEKYNDPFWDGEDE